MITKTRALAALLWSIPALARAVYANDPLRLAAVHDRADRIAGRQVFLPEANPADVFAVLADARAITMGTAT